MVPEEMIGVPGVRVMEVNLRPDDRGFFGEVYRSDWREFFAEDIRQTNVSLSYSGIVRAWHRHSRGQVDYFTVLRGSLRICVYNPETRALAEMVSSEHRPTVVRVPGHFYHGTMAVAPDPTLVLYFTSALYDREDPDEERLPWNDPSICPATINGRVDDLRVGQPWDWLRPPHR